MSDQQLTEELHKPIIIDSDADAKANDEAKPNDDEAKTNFNDKKQPVKLKIAIFCLHFY